MNHHLSYQSRVVGYHDDKSTCLSTVIVAVSSHTLAFSFEQGKMRMGSLTGESPTMPCDHYKNPDELCLLAVGSSVLFLVAATCVLGTMSRREAQREPEMRELQSENGGRSCAQRDALARVQELHRVSK